MNTSHAPGRPNVGTSSPLRSHAPNGMPPPRGRELQATFHGNGVLTVRSSATGALYRFEGRGACLVIDPRDALLLGRLSDVQVG